MNENIPGKGMKKHQAKKWKYPWQRNEISQGMEWKYPRQRNEKVSGKEMKKHQAKKWNIPKEEWNTLGNNEMSFHYACLGISYHNFSRQLIDGCAGNCLGFIIKGGGY